MGDLAGGRAQGRVVPTKIVYVGDHALHRRAEIVADAEPVEAIVDVRADPWIPEAIDVALRAHEEHGCAGESRVEGPGETALGASVAVEPAPEALGQIKAAVSGVVVDLVVRTGQVVDQMPRIGIGKVADPRAEVCRRH